MNTEDDFLNYEDSEDGEEFLRICTFGVSQNSDYVKLIKDNGGPLLQISFEQAVKDINNYKNEFYDEAIVERNKRFLIARWYRYRGILFEDIL